MASMVWGHHAVVGSHDDDTEVGDLSATGTHGSKRFVARGVEECDVASVGQFHIICTDMLCDATGLAGDHIGVADIVEERCLTVVHMAHDSHDGGAGGELVFGVFNALDSLNHFGRYIFGLVAKLVGHDVDGLGIKTLIDRHHHADVHTCGYDIVDRHIHHHGKVVGGDKLGELQGAAFSLLGLHGFALA